MNGMMRTIGRLAAVAAVALTLSGSAVPPIAAAPNDAAKRLMRFCRNVDGVPYYFEFMGVWEVGCDYTTVMVGRTD